MHEFSKYTGLFHFISMQECGCKIPGLPWKNRIPMDRVGGGKMSMVGQSRSPEIFICMPKIKKPMMKNKHFYFLMK